MVDIQMKFIEVDLTLYFSTLIFVYSFGQIHCEDAYISGTSSTSGSRTNFYINDLKGENIEVEPTQRERRRFSRYLLYDVNHGEGFNLRRDVYMRVANLVKELNKHEPWTLVLPPWGRVYHWKSLVDQERIPWGTFFNLTSMRQHINVIELDEFLSIASPLVEETYYLQSYKEGWNGKWVQKMDFRPCLQNTGYREEGDVWRGWFWGYGGRMATAKFSCVSIQSHASFMKDFLLHKTKAGSILIDRAESLLHDMFGDAEYWKARRSMVFSSALTEIADEFRRDFLNSNDIRDLTVKDEWQNMKRLHGAARGGDYLAVHLRRADFLYGHKDEVPSLAGAAEQITALLQQLGLVTVFICTDAPDNEFGELRKYLKDYAVVRYVPDEDTFAKYKDGGRAIIDQWIAAHSRYFIGTAQSTFSFRIQEEREILGFSPETTFNCLCAEHDPKCEQPSKWTIHY